MINKLTFDFANKNYETKKFNLRYSLISFLTCLPICLLCVFGSKYFTEIYMILPPYLAIISCIGFIISFVINQNKSLKNIWIPIFVFITCLILFIQCIRLYSIAADGNARFHIVYYFPGVLKMVKETDINYSGQYDYQVLGYLFDPTFIATFLLFLFSIISYSRFAKRKGNNN